MKPRIAFIVHNAALWSALHPLYVEMKTSNKFLLKVFTIPADHTSRGNYVGEEQTLRDLRRLDITAIPTRDKRYAEHLEKIKAFAPDFLFRQTPWDNHLPEPFRVYNLNFTKLCYVPYGFMTAKIENHQFNQPFHHACWSIFCETKLHKMLAKKYCLVEDSNVIVAGFPRFEEILNRKDERFWPIETKDGDLKIIWAPHHSITKEWLGFSTFIANHMYFLNLARRNSNFSIVLRPHPALFSKLLANGVPQGDIDKFIEEFTSLPNTALYTDGEYIPLFWSSDILLSDGIGFFSEYMLTNKPIIYTDSGYSIGFNDAGKMLESGMYKVKNTEDIHVVLNNITAGQDYLAEKRKKIAAILLDKKGLSPSKFIVQVLEKAYEVEKN